MPHIHSKSSRPATAAVVLVIASLALAACGGSSSTSGTTATSASSTAPGSSTTGATKGGFPGAARFAALRECLKKNGVSLPGRTPGKRPGGGVGGLLGGGAGPVLPKGVSRAQYDAILKKCGGGFARRFGAGTARFNSPEAKKALMKFAACMRADGVKIGEPNTSGKGAIFDTKGIDTASTQFTTAERKCQSYLHSAFGGRPGAGGTGGAPGAAGTAPGGTGAEPGAAPPAGAGG
jgi:hypothetical protein